MDRHSRGMPLTVQAKQPLYYNGEFPEIQGLDLTEIAALKRAASENVKKLQKQLKDQEQEKYNEQQRKVQKQIEDLQKQLEEAGKQARGKVEGEARTNPIS